MHFWMAAAGLGWIIAVVAVRGCFDWRVYHTDRRDEWRRDREALMKRLDKAEKESADNAKRLTLELERQSSAWRQEANRDERKAVTVQKALKNISIEVAELAAVFEDDIADDEE